MSGRLGVWQAGDLLISNHTSLLDVLYLASRFLPLFTAFSLGPQVCTFYFSSCGGLHSHVQAPLESMSSVPDVDAGVKWGCR